MSEPLALRDLDPGDRPNHYFLAPSGSGNPRADATSPILPVSADRLLALALDVADRQARTRRTALDRDARHAVYEQRSAVLGFVDDIDIAIVPVDDGSATLAIYSRSRIGYWDLGVNRRRVLDWLGQIRAAVTDRVRE